MVKIVDEFNECLDCSHRHDSMWECPECGSDRFRQLVEYSDGTIG